MTKAPFTPIPSGGHCRLNVRLLAILLTVAAVGSAGLYLLHGWQTNRNADALLLRAEAAKENGEHAEASRLLSQYLNYRPEDNEARARLAMLLEESASSAKSLLDVFLLYERVLRETPERHDLRRRLAEVALRLGRYRDALGHLDELRGGSPDDPELLFLEGRCEEGRGRYAPAARAYAAAIEHAGHEIDYYDALCSLIVSRPAEIPLSEIDPQHRKDPAAEVVAEEWLSRMVAAGQPQHRALLVRARRRMDGERHAEAAEDIRRALELAGEEPELLETAATLQLQRAQAADREGQDAEAAEHLRNAAEYVARGLARQPPVLGLHLTRARIALARNDVEAAVTALNEGLSSFPAAYDQPAGGEKQELIEVEQKLLFTLADLTIQFPDLVPNAPEVGEPGSPAHSVGSLISRMKQLGMPREYTEFLAAEQLVENQRWSLAAEKLDALRIPLARERSLIRRIHLLLGRCRDARGNPDSQLAGLRRAVEADPLWTEGRLELARALVGARRLDEAAEEYRLLLSVEGVAAELVRLKMLQELARPGDQRDWSALEKILVEAERQGAETVPVTILRAELLTQQQRFEEAAGLLQGLPAEPEVRSAEALLALYRTDQSLDQRIDASLQIVEQAEAEFGHRLDWDLIRADCALLQPEEAALASLRRLEQSAANHSASDQKKLLTRIGAIYDRLQAEERSRTVWTRLAKAHPHELKYWLELAEPLSERGEIEALQPILGEIRRIEGADGPNAKVIEAVALLARAESGRNALGDLERVGELLAEAARRRTNWAAIPRAQGRVAELSGDVAAALEHFRHALRLGDHSPEVVLRVLQYLAESNRPEEAVQLARRLGAGGSGVLSGDVGRLARTLAVRQGDFDEARQFAGGLARHSNDVWDQIWFAEVRYLSGERGSDVDELYRQAVNGAPDEPAAWLGLVRHLVRTGQTAEARVVLPEAEQALASSDAALLTVARCYEMLGSRAEAEEYYRRAVDQHPGSARHLKALASYYQRTGQIAKAGEALSRLSTTGSDGDVAWARRNEALLLARQGGYDRAEQALELLSGAEDAESLRVKASILALRPSQSDRLQAIQLLEQVDQREPGLASGERFELAQLLEATGNWRRAKQEYLRAFADQEPTPQRLGRFIQGLLRQNELGEAAAWLKKLQRTSPEGFLTAAARTRLLHATGRTGQAVTCLQSWLADQVPVPLAADFLALTRQEDVPQAIRELADDASALDSASAGALSEARRLLDEGHAEAAEALIRQHVLSHELKLRRYAERLSIAASLLEELEQHEPAEALFRAGIEFTGRPESVCELARFLSRRDRMEEALDLCARVVGQWDVELHARAVMRLVGRQKLSDKHMKQVEAWVEAAVAERPESLTSLAALADLRVTQERFQEAEELYRRILTANDRHVAALNNAAWLSAVSGTDSREPIRWIGRAIEVAGPRPELLDTRGLIHIRQNRPDSAIVDLQAALRERPFALGYLHLAQARWMLRDQAAARQAFQTARDLGLDRDELHPVERQIYDELNTRLTLASASR